MSVFSAVIGPHDPSPSCFFFNHATPRSIAFRMTSSGLPSSSMIFIDWPVKQ
jgi:hypothetical protein